MSFHIPGFLWVLLIALAIFLAETFIPDPFYSKLVVLVLFAVAKGFDLKGGELETLLTVLRQIKPQPVQRPPEKTEMRGVYRQSTAEQTYTLTGGEAVHLIAAQETAKKFTAKSKTFEWLWG